MRKQVREQLCTGIDQSKEKIDQSVRLERDWGEERGCEVFI